MLLFCVFFVLFKSFVAAAKHIIVKTGAAKVAKGGINAVSASAFGAAFELSGVGQFFLKLGKLGHLKVYVLNNAVAKSGSRAVVFAAVVVCLTEIFKGGVNGRFLSCNGNFDFLNFDCFGGLLRSCR